MDNVTDEKKELDREGVFLARWVLWCIIGLVIMSFSIVAHREFWISIGVYGAYIWFAILISPVLVYHGGPTIKYLRLWARYIRG